MQPPTPNPTRPASTKVARKIFDWISHPPPEYITPFQQFIIDVDWNKSPLGPMETWPAQLRQMVLIVVADPTPAVVYWGDEATIVYNEAYTELIGSKHPALQGQDPKIEFAEIWDYFEKLLSTQRETGLTTMEGNQLLMLKRHGFLEETYFSWKFVPIIGNEGYVVGSHATVVEVTREVISDRRMSTVRALSREIAATKTIKGLWNQILQGLEHADKDVPLALLYSIADVSDSVSSPAETGLPRNFTGSMECNLEGSVGLQKAHSIAPQSVDLLHDRGWLAEPFRKATRGTSQVVLHVEDGSLPSDILEGIQWRGYGIPSTTMVVCPIHSTYSEDAVAFLVVALNPRRPYDDDYENFVHMLTKQITTPQVSSVLLREEVFKRQTVAKQEAIDRAKLSQELTTLALEFEETETIFSRFAARAQVGLAIFSDTGLTLYANNLWRELTQLEVGVAKTAWDKAIVPADLEFVALTFDRLVLDKTPSTFHFRVNRPWKTPIPDKHGRYTVTDTYVLCSAYPDLDENGKVTTVMSCLTDISELKWIEAQLRRRTADVEQREQMWRNFTDCAPIGLCLINADGSLEFGNDTWWSMTETPRDETSGLSWLQKSVLPEDIPKVERLFQDALVQNMSATLEFRLNRLWKDPIRHEEQGEVVQARTTILGTVHTTFNDDGTVRHLVGWLTDISAQKAAEGVLRMRMDQAIEMKQQQERFIDVSRPLPTYDLYSFNIDDFPRNAKSTLCDAPLCRCHY
jgi:PAS domain-containing protein